MRAGERAQFGIVRTHEQGLVVQVRGLVESFRSRGLLRLVAQRLGDAVEQGLGLGVLRVLLQRLLHVFVRAVFCRRDESFFRDALVGAFEPERHEVCFVLAQTMARRREAHTTRRRQRSAGSRRQRR
jgi:hypothetical protein